MFNFDFAIINFIVGLVPVMEASMEAQEGLYNKAEVLETALFEVLEREGVCSPSFWEVDKALQGARKELKVLEQQEEEAFLALLEVLSEVPAVSLVSRLHEAQKAMEEAQKAFSSATSQRDWNEALVAVWKAEKTLSGLEAQVLEFPGDDPVLFEAVIRLKAATV